MKTSQIVMDSTEIKAKLKEVGFTYFNDEKTLYDFELEKFYACKKIVGDLPQCRCNDKNPQFVVNYSNIDIHGESRQSITVDLTAEGDEKLWYSLRVYGLFVDEYFEKREKIEKDLIAAWIAVNCPESK